MLPNAPKIIKSVDKIAREMGKDILFLEFLSINKEQDYRHFKAFKHRQDTIVWLYDMGIHFEECLPYSEGEEWTGGYLGHLYFPSAVMSEDDGLYRTLKGHFENKDETSRIDGVDFYYLPLEEALKNCHIDPIPNKMQRRKR